MASDTKTRTLLGLVMVSVFFVVLFSKMYTVIMLSLVGIEVKVFQELRSLELTPSKVYLSRSQAVSDWLLFTICMVSAISCVLAENISAVILSCFWLYTLWFMGWIWLIIDEQPQELLAQYLLHTFWIHVASFYTAAQPVAITINMMKGGTFWFLFPCVLVICNDTAAYFCGKRFGKTKLMNISPNKTVEGFIGATIVTVVLGFVASGCLIIPNSENTQADLINNSTALHGFLLGSFASIIAPFGGYFASALKRAANLKDFGSYIPGHGGLTDRVDCQLFMAVFTCLYFNYITTQ